MIRLFRRDGAAPGEPSHIAASKRDLVLSCGRMLHATADRAYEEIFVAGKCRMESFSRARWTR
jgi:hypothetical protein